MQGNWFAVNRLIFEHPLFKDNHKWLVAFLRIISDANYKDDRGNVCLTESYRFLNKEWTHSQWRHFINTLVKEKMLENIESKNHGKTIGYLTTARVVNYEKYQPKTEKIGEKSSAEHCTERTQC